MGKHKALGCIAHSNLVIVRALRELHTDEPFPSFRVVSQSWLEAIRIDTDCGEGGTDGVINSVGAALVRLNVPKLPKTKPI